MEWATWGFIVVDELVMLMDLFACAKAVSC